MGRYTVREEPAVEARVEADLAVIRAAVTAELGSDLVGLLLVGGFGRGEGSVIFVRGLPYALNDYDLVVVLRGRRPHDALQPLGDRLALELGIAHVDLLPVAAADLPAATPTIFTFDMKNGSIVLDGPPDLRAPIPDHPAAALPRSEAEILLVNRLTCLLECATEATLAGPGRPSEELAMAYMAAKVVLTAVEAEAVLGARYSTSYEEKARRHEGGGPDLVPVMTDFKLRPATPVPFDPRWAWDEARRLYLSTFAAVFGVPVERWPARRLRRWYFFLRRVFNLAANRPRYRDWTGVERRSRAEAAEMETILAARGGSFDRARRLLRPLVPDRPLDTWEDLRAACVLADDRYIHPHARQGPDLFGPALARIVDEA